MKPFKMVPVESTPAMDAAGAATFPALNFDEVAAEWAWNAMLAAAPSPWVSVEERLPASGAPVLAFYENRLGKGRRICAEYIASKSRVADQLSDPDVETVKYDEEVGEYYWLPGWYERIDNWEEYSHLAVSEGDVTHWMPLPEAPEVKP